MADNKEYEILIDGEDDIEVETDSVSYLPFDNKTINQNSKGEMQAIGITNGTDIIDYDTIKAGLDKPAPQPFEFETKKDFEDWLNGTFIREDGRTTDDLLIGNDVYIVEKSVPDYWCKSVTKPFSIEKNFEEMETDVDNGLSDTSINPVQNKVITEALKDKQQTLIAGTNMEIKDNVISSEIPKSSATILGGVYLYKIGTVWNIDLTGNDPVVRIPEGTTVLTTDMLPTAMEVLIIPSSLTSNNAAITKNTVYTKYRELRAPQSTIEDFINNINIGSYRYSLGGTMSGSGKVGGNPVDLYLNDVLQTDISISGTVDTIKGLTGYSFKTLTINEGTTTIGDVEYCSNLETVNLPKSITSIMNYAFVDCTNLAAMNYAGTMAEWSLITLGRNWHRQTPLKEIKCIDGTITL